MTTQTVKPKITSRSMQIRMAAIAPPWLTSVPHMDTVGCKDAPAR